tara:strand:+ start:9673 stop:10887 length:1215 start_codon:yes stop_codon:yes gene_type:complete
MNTSLPLKGIRILDFCWVLAGPLGTRILANYGAEIIKIETDTHQSSKRTGIRPDGTPGPNIDPLYNNANTGKKSFTVNLKTKEGKNIIKQLISISDVTTNNFRPSVMGKLGFDYESLKKINPKIIMVNIPGCSVKGPWSNIRTLGNMIMGSSGLNSITGFPERPPSGMGVAYPDFTTPYIIATSILAALLERSTTGKGQELNIGQLATAIPLLGVEWMQFKSTGIQPEKKQNRDLNFCPHGLYPSKGKDQWCAIAVKTDREWKNLCKIIDRPELINNNKFQSHSNRKTNENEIDAELSKWTININKWEIANILQDHGIASAAVEDLQETLLIDPHMQNHYQHVVQPSDKDLDIVIDKDPIKFNSKQNDLTRSPMMGEHNNYVLNDLLNISKKEIDKLISNGIIK